MSIHADRARPALESDSVMIGFGQVRHARLKPVQRAFAYATFFVLLPMRELGAASGGALAVNRRGALSFHDKDHGDGRGPEAGGALGWLQELLAREGVADAHGPIWLHTYPRVLGYTFKPVSFWYCHRQDGTLAAIVVEVNNTFGERHCYLLPAPRFGEELTAAKVFHVSPFCEVRGRYRFRFLFDATRERTVARIDYDDDTGPLLVTSVNGTLVPLDAASRRRALWGHPVMTLAVIARIHWQALGLWLARVRFHTKPKAPDAFVSR